MARSDLFVISKSSICVLGITNGEWARRGFVTLRFDLASALIFPSESSGE